MTDIGINMRTILEIGNQTTAFTTLLLWLFLVIVSQIVFLNVILFISTIRYSPRGNNLCYYGV